MLLLLATLFMLATAVPSAFAMRVGGTLVSANGEPLSSRDLHFQNCVTEDIYLSPTHENGSFAQQLPPGCYQLRDETGAIILHQIYVTKYDVNLGPVREPSHDFFAQIFERQSIFPTLLTSPAPSTAYVYTRDLAAGLLPPSAVKVPVPSSESAWLRLEAQAKSINTNIMAPPPVTVLNSPNAMRSMPSGKTPLFNEPSLNPQQAVSAPPPGTPHPSPYQ